MYHELPFLCCSYVRNHLISTSPSSRFFAGKAGKAEKAINVTDGNVIDGNDIDMTPSAKELGIPARRRRRSHRDPYRDGTELCKESRKSVATVKASGRV